jgi:hypothetical protein
VPEIAQKGLARKSGHTLPSVALSFFLKISFDKGAAKG